MRRLALCQTKPPARNRMDNLATAKQPRVARSAVQTCHHHNKADSKDDERRACVELEQEIDRVCALGFGAKHDAHNGVKQDQQCKANLRTAQRLAEEERRDQHVEHQSQCTEWSQQGHGRKSEREQIACTARNDQSETCMCRIENVNDDESTKTLTTPMFTYKANGSVHHPLVRFSQS